MPNKGDRDKRNFRIENSNPFAFWSLPGSKTWQGIIQDDSNIPTPILNEMEGFLVSSFINNGEERIIRSDKKVTMSDSFEIDIENWNYLENAIKPIEINKKDYLTQCALLIEWIKKGECDKVVLSRVKKEKCSHDPKMLFLTLVDKYPTEMVFMYSFGSEIWIGASPETLLKYKDGKFMTMALAGSMAVNDLREWSQKEIVEQAYVESYIEEILKAKGISYKKIGPKDKEAGPVKHLLSEYEGEIEENEFIQLVNDLHPTPAVCGIPLKKASMIIKKIEVHSRRDYTGYFGPISKENTHLFVNLRSAMLIDKEIFLFLGGGITEDSNPEDEWNETELKANTLLSIL